MFETQIFCNNDIIKNLSDLIYLFFVISCCSLILVKKLTINACFAYYLQNTSYDKTRCCFADGYVMILFF